MAFPQYQFYDANGNKITLNATPNAGQNTGANSLGVVLASDQTVMDGWDLTQGSKADAAYTGSGSASVVATLKGIYNATLAPLAAGTNTIGTAKLLSDAAATSTPLATTTNDTIAHTYGPFTPQLGRELWLTLNATVAASGTAQLLRSTDGGATKIGLTAGGTLIGSYTFTSTTGVIVNEIMGVETDSAATYYLSITLSAGTVTSRVAQ